MNKAAALLGIIGGVLGFGSAMFSVLFGLAAAGLKSDAASEFAFFAIGGVSASVLSILFGALMFSNTRKLVPLLLLLSSILGMATGGSFVFVCMVLPLLGGIIGLIGTTKTITEQPAQTAPIQQTVAQPSTPPSIDAQHSAYAPTTVAEPADLHWKMVWRVLLKVFLYATAILVLVGIFAALSYAVTQAKQSHANANATSFVQSDANVSQNSPQPSQDTSFQVDNKPSEPVAKPEGKPFAPISEDGYVQERKNFIQTNAIAKTCERLGQELHRTLLSPQKVAFIADYTSRTAAWLQRRAACSGFTVNQIDRLEELAMQECEYKDPYCSAVLQSHKASFEWLETAVPGFMQQTMEMCRRMNAVPEDAPEHMTFFNTLEPQVCATQTTAQQGGERFTAVNTKPDSSTNVFIPEMSRQEQLEKLSLVDAWRRIEGTWVLDADNSKNQFSASKPLSVAQTYKVAFAVNHGQQQVAIVHPDETRVCNVALDQISVDDANNPRSKHPFVLNDVFVGGVKTGTSAGDDAVGCTIYNMKTHTHKVLEFQEMQDISFNRDRLGQFFFDNNKVIFYTDKEVWYFKKADQDTSSTLFPDADLITQ